MYGLHVRLCTMRLQYLQGPEEGTDPLELELQSAVSCLSHGTWNITQPVLLTAEPSLLVPFITFETGSVMGHGVH